MNAEFQQMDMQAQTALIRQGFGGKVEKEINGRRVRCETRWNRGRSGKGFTTLWYVDGKRCAVANLQSAVFAA
jgi:hypothetical protein